jgi:hypothetical protein
LLAIKKEKNMINLIKEVLSDGSKILDSGCKNGDISN